MLKRVGSFKTDGIIFVKTVKYNQDYRFDVPVLGLRTLDTKADHNIKTAVLKAGDVIMVEKDKDPRRSQTQQDPDHRILAARYDRIELALHTSDSQL